MNDLIKNPLLKKVWLNTKSSLSKLLEYLFLAWFSAPTLFIYYGLKTNQNPSELIKAISPVDLGAMLLFLTILCAFYIFIKEILNSETETTIQDIFGGLDGNFDKDGNFEGIAQTPNGNYRVNFETVIEETTAKVKTKANA